MSSGQQKEIAPNGEPVESLGHSMAITVPTGALLGGSWTRVGDRRGTEEYLRGAASHLTLSILEQCLPNGTGDAESLPPVSQGARGSP